MIFKHAPKNKKTLLSIFIAFLAIGIFLFLYSPVIFQEGNPWFPVKGIIRLDFSHANMVKLSESENEYMTKSKNGQEIVKNFMKDRGYDFTGQMGSGYFFQSLSGKDAVVIHKYYSRYFSLWKITENEEDKKNEEGKESNLAKELMDCLPKSDMASYEKCNNLLKQITDYNSCVEAGFSIMKSNPPQCATPDGRSFTQIN